MKSNEMILLPVDEFLSGKEIVMSQGILRLLSKLKPVEIAMNLLDLKLDQVPKYVESPNNPNSMVERVAAQLTKGHFPEQLSPFTESYAVGDKNGARENQYMTDGEALTDRLSKTEKTGRPLTLDLAVWAVTLEVASSTQSNQANPELDSKIKKALDNPSTFLEHVLRIATRKLSQIPNENDASPNSWKNTADTLINMYPDRAVWTRDLIKISANYDEVKNAN